MLAHWQSLALLETILLVSAAQLHSFTRAVVTPSQLRALGHHRFTILNAFQGQSQARQLRCPALVQILGRGSF